MFFKIVYFTAFIAYSSSTGIKILNNSPDENVFVQTLHVANQLKSFLLEPQQSETINFTDFWAGDIWGRTDCASEEECGLEFPASFAEISPSGGVDCEDVSCNAPILEECPDELKIFNDADEVIACKSNCNEDDCPNAAWFKEKCPHAFVTPTDDFSNVYMCETDELQVTFF